MPLVRSLIKGTNFRRFLDFVSPTFFDVMPARGLFRTASELVKGYRDREAFEEALDHRRRRAETRGIPARIVERRPSSAGRLPELEEPERRAIGNAALRLYFHQLYDDGPTLLNLSVERFDHDGETPIWAPGPGIYRWPVEFRSALGDVYRSFYRSGGNSLEEALDPLGLTPAADLFREHFGSGDQRAVRFRVETFVEAFHKVFLRCKEHGVRLDPAFLALGIYLATLYETLEQVGLPLDVRGAFDATYPEPANSRP